MTSLFFPGWCPRSDEGAGHLLYTTFHLEALRAHNNNFPLLPALALVAIHLVSANIESHCLLPRLLSDCRA